MMETNTIMIEDESLLVKNFVIKQKQGRYTELLSSKKGRKKILNYLCHKHDFDEKFIKEIPSNQQNHGGLCSFVEGLGKANECYVICLDHDMDKTRLAISDAISRCLSKVDVFILSIIPGRLVLFFGEGSNNIFVLSKP